MFFSCDCLYFTVQSQARRGHLLTFSSAILSRSTYYEGYKISISNFRVKRLQRYCGASTFRDLKTIILDSSITSSLTVFYQGRPNRGLLRRLWATVLKFLQLINFSQAGAAPNETKVSNMWLSNTSVECLLSISR